MGKDIMRPPLPPAAQVCVPWMLSTPATPDNLSKRRKLFAGAAISQVRGLALPSRVLCRTFTCRVVCPRKSYARPPPIKPAGSWALHTGDLPSRHIATDASRFAVPQGLLVAPLVRVALAVHPGVLFTAFGATACELGESWAAVALGLAAAQAPLHVLAVATAQHHWLCCPSIASCRHPPPLCLQACLPASPPPRCCPPAAPTSTWVACCPRCSLRSCGKVQLQAGCMPRSAVLCCELQGLAAGCIPLFAAWDQVAFGWASQPGARLWHTR